MFYKIDSIYFLELLYYYGFGGSKDVDKAIETFTRSAKEGHVHSQLALGVINSQIKKHSIYIIIIMMNRYSCNTMVASLSKPTE